MSEFVNREGTNLNKRVIEVTDVQFDASGKITSLTGLISRADSYTEEGTPLNAQAMNSIVQSIANNLIDANVNNEEGSIQTKINHLIDANVNNAEGSIQTKINNLIDVNVNDTNGSIQNKIRTMANGIAKSYTDQALEESEEEMLLTIEQMIKNVVEKYVEFTVEEMSVDMLYDENNNLPHIEVNIPVEETVSIELEKKYDDLFIYEHGQESSQNYVVAIQAKVDLEDCGTCEYEHKFIFRSTETGKIVKKVYLMVRYTTPSISPED